MMDFLEKHRKTIFWMLIIGTFLTIGIYNFLTPYYTDDLGYALEARSAHSLWDLLKQQYTEYMYHNCRVIGQFNLRLFLIPGKWLFNLVNSAMFTALVLLIYASANSRKKHDVFLLLLSIIFVWRYSVQFGETNLWLCGSCNYLWGSVIIMGFLVWYRHMLERTDKWRHSIPVAFGSFFFGLAAGWCNENTSGGAFLLVVFFTGAYLWNQEGRQKIAPFMITSAMGVLTGVMAMALCPGIRYRIGQTEEEVLTGAARILSRIYKITITVREQFGELFIILVIALVILVLQKKIQDWKSIGTNTSVLYLLAAIATSYALVVIAPTTARAHYGAGVFLMAACLEAIAELDRRELFVKTLQYSFVTILCLWLFTTYFENLVNLWRIQREDRERIEIILEEKSKNGAQSSVVIPQLRPEFENPYSTAHDSDLTEDKDHWINSFYEVYYGVDSIIAIPREEWDELYGNGEQ